VLSQAETGELLLYPQDAVCDNLPLTAVLDPPSALFGEAAELAVRIHRDGLVGPFERRLVGDMIRINAEVAKCVAPGF
jgi:hypothetical protein